MEESAPERIHVEITAIEVPASALAKAEVPEAKVTSSPLTTPVSVPVIVAGVVPLYVLLVTAAFSIVNGTAVISAVKPVGSETM